MKTSSRSALPLGFLVAGLLLTACATGGSQEKPLPRFTEEQTEKAAATVTAIDQQTRLVSLKAQSGEEFDFVAGPQIRNLAQVQVGDQVVVEYTEKLAVEVKRATGAEPAMTVAEGGGRAEPGQKPGAGVGRQVTISAVIVAIDKENRRVTVRGPAGNFRVIEVKDPKNMENLQVGDMVYATYTEALGISLEKAAK